MRARSYVWKMQSRISCHGIEFAQVVDQTDSPLANQDEA